MWLAKSDEKLWKLVPGQDLPRTIDVTYDKFIANKIEFTQKFPDKESCYIYPEKIKLGKGFGCRRYGHEQYYKGKHGFPRRCKSCAYEESVTASK